MNLKELSIHLKMPQEKLTEWMDSELHIILLSDTAPIQQSTLETILAYYQDTDTINEEASDEETSDKEASAEETSDKVSPPAQKNAAPAESERGRQTLAFMEDCLKKNFLLLVDTCSIMGNVSKGYSSFLTFMKRVEPLLRQYDKKVIIPYIVYSEVEWFKNKVPHTKRGKQAARLLPELDEMMRTGLLIKAGSREDWPRSVEKPFADDFLYSKVSNMRTNGRNVLVITQDQGLTADLNSITERKSVVASAAILVRKLDDKDGILSEYPNKTRKEK